MVSDNLLSVPFELQLLLSTFAHFLTELSELHKGLQGGLDPQKMLQGLITTVNPTFMAWQCPTSPTFAPAGQGLAGSSCCCAGEAELNLSWSRRLPLCPQPLRSLCYPEVIPMYDTESGSDLKTASCHFFPSVEFQLFKIFN